MHDYPGMKRADLLALAGKAGVKGRSRMTKKQLIEVLEGLSEASGPVGDRAPASEPPVPPVLPPLPSPPGGPPELPAFLGGNRIALLPQGPRTAFAYWEIAGEEGFPDLLLQVFSSPAWTEIARNEVSGRTGSYYIRVDRSGIEIEAVLGRVRDGRFHPILRSNRVRLPDDAPSPDLPDLWMTRRDGTVEVSPLSPDMVRGGLSPGQVQDRSPGHPASSWPRGPGRGLP